MRALLLVIALTACGRLRFAQLADATSGDSVTPGATCDPAAVELCNGIDDNCNGLVDEGCPCTPFTLTYPSGVARTMVSTGTDWLVFSGGIVQIDETGTVIGTGPDPKVLSLSDDKQQYTWNGTELVYLDGGAGTLMFSSPDGSSVHAGPPTGLSPGAPWVRWRDGGFDVAIETFEIPPHIEFVRTDATGTVSTGIAKSAAWASVNPIGLADRRSNPLLYWTEQDPSFGVRGEITAPDPPNPFVPTLATNGDGIWGDADSDGVHALLEAGDELWAVDDSGVTALPLTFTGDIDSLAWTGNGWDIVMESPGGNNPLVISRVHLDTTYTITDTEAVITVPFTTGIGGNPGSIVSDARRSLIERDIAVDSGPQMAYFAQTCH